MSLEEIANNERTDKILDILIYLCINSYCQVKRKVLKMY